MMRFILLLFLLFVHPLAKAQSQKVIGDCTVTYGIAGDNGTTLLLYVKGNGSRIDISSTAYNQSTIYDNKTGTAVILQEIGGNKYMSQLDAAHWREQNKKYNGMKITFAPETKIILGYECKKARVDLKDGSSFTLYYATSIIPSARENPFKFKDIPGFVLEYEAEKSGKKNNITYTATKINFDPVPSSKFEIPAKGYMIRNN